MKKKFHLAIVLATMFIGLSGYSKLYAVADTLDYGFYWFGANNQSAKAVASNGTPNSVGTSLYDPSKPTVLYFHGWQKDSAKNNYYRETFMYNDPTKSNASVDTIAQWKADGWNVAIFYWNQMADEAEVKDAEAKLWSTAGPKGMRYRLSDGTYGTALTPTKSVGELALAQYTAMMVNYQGSEVRFAGHSLGSQLAVNLAKLVSDYVAVNTSKIKIMPNRLELLDPFWSKDAKTYLGDKYGSAFSSCNGTKDGKNDWNAEVVRCYIYNMINKNNLVVTWFKTSGISDTGVGDSNSALQPIVAFQNVASFWLNATDQGGKHVWARYVYFWSKSVPASSGFPKEYTLSGSTKTPTGKIVSYANTPNSRVKEMMGNTYLWNHIDGRNTPNPNDDWYERKTR